MFTGPSVVIKSPKVQWVLDNVVHLADLSISVDETLAKWAVTTAEAIADELERRGYL